MVTKQGSTTRTYTERPEARRRGDRLGWLAALLLALVVLGAAAALLAGVVSVNIGDGPGADGPAQVGRTDAEIARDLERALARDPRLADQRIVVNVTEKMVTLSGVVASFGQKTLATQIAREVPGGVLLQNQLQVRPPEPLSDAELRELVLTGLRLNYVTRVATERLTVDVADGVVTLNGTVDSLAVKHVAEEVAASMVGVRDVRNTIAVQPQATRTDAEITAEVEHSINSHPLLRDQSIEVRTQNGTIILTGAVRDLTSYALAERLAAFTHGARAVENELRVVQ